MGFANLTVLCASLPVLCATFTVPYTTLTVPSANLTVSCATLTVPSDLDFRSELSAFDKFFYFGNTKGSKAKNKQEFIRTKSLSLSKLFAGTKAPIGSSKRILNEPLEI